MRAIKTTTILFLLTAIFISAHSPKNSTSEKRYYHSSQTLFDTILRMDSLLFNAFNRHDLSALSSFFTKDLEFYHDKGGLTNYDQNMESFKKIVDQNNDLRRELVKSSLEVYPVENYGAMQIGSHTFCHTENGKKDCGTFRFVHIWKKENGEWKISRVISYGH